MSYDPDSASDRADHDEGPRCRCGGRGYIQFDKENPYACEPCGCDEEDHDEDDR